MPATIRSRTGRGSWLASARGAEFDGRVTSDPRARLLDAIRSQLQDKFGSKGARVVEDNMRVVKRGFSRADKVLRAEEVVVTRFRNKPSEPDRGGDQ